MCVYAWAILGLAERTLTYNYIDHQKKVVSFYLQVVYGIIEELSGFYGDSHHSSKWFCLVLFMRKGMKALNA